MMEEVVGAWSSVDDGEDDLAIIKGLKSGVLLAADDVIGSREGRHGFVGHVEVC